MTPNDVLLEMLGISRFVMTSYLSDLSDDELFVRPASGAHTAAWQLGHLIVSERRMIDAVASGYGIVLPEGFEEAHPKDAGHAESSLRFSKSEYENLMHRQRTKTLQVLKSFSAEALSAPAPDFMRAYAAKVGSVFVTVASHELMHAGQIAVIRRILEKPVVI